MHRRVFQSFGPNALLYRGLSLAPHSVSLEFHTLRKWLAYLGKLVANTGCNGYMTGLRKKESP